MHGDFKNNLIRFHLLKEARNKEIKVENFTDFFDNKAIHNVAKEEVERQLKHLSGEGFLAKTSDLNYNITDAGKEEIGEVEKALKKF